MRLRALGPMGGEDAGGGVALLALVHIGHRVVHLAGLAFGVDELDRQPGAGALEHGLRLVRVPDIGGGRPALGLADQQPGLDEAHVVRRPTEINGIGEGLDEGGPHREVQGPDGGVGGGLARWKVGVAELLGVVAEQRGVQAIGDDPAVGRAGAGVDEQAIGLQGRGRRLGQQQVEVHRPGRGRGAEGERRAGRRQEGGQAPHAPEASWSAGSTTLGGSGRAVPMVSVTVGRACSVAPALGRLRFTTGPSFT